MRKRLHGLFGVLTFGICSVWACNSDVSSGGGGTGGAGGQGGVDPGPSTVANGTGAGGNVGQGGVDPGPSSTANGTGAGGAGGEGGVDPSSSTAANGSGAGGTGGQGGGDSGASSSAGGGGAVCVSSSDFTKCKESSGGQCFCDGTCDGNPVHVYCHWVNTTQFCSCYANSVLIGECQGADPCLVEKTCCADLF